ncbi:MAG: hypothetical protein M1438_07515 [Deltaproteobacteria bacterium]|nr:hypothetical protein [Deltaproteobacteria bacterium]
MVAQAFQPVPKKMNCPLVAEICLIGNLWQDERFDRILRDYDEFLEKWNYIHNNPVKTGLCQAPEDYAFLWEPESP